VGCGVLIDVNVRRLGTLLAAIALASLLVGCSGKDRPSVGEEAAAAADATGYQVRPGERLDRDFSYRAVATGTLFVYDDPDLESGTTRIHGEPVQLPILGPYNRHDGWYPVRLPEGKGGGQGWVLAEQVLAERVSHAVAADGTELATGGGTATVHLDDSAGSPTETFANPTDADGAKVAPVVFLARGAYDPAADWIEVYLPTRPNGSTGFVRADQVTVTTHTYRVRVELGAHRMQVFDGADKVFDEPIGVGTGETPTPGGLFYIRSLIASTNPVYGPYAYGLSGFSEVHESFNGGPGDIGIHGTDDPGAVGTDVSNGCIRLRNEDISRLAPILPYATPVEIRA
jgi:lipoprotein-anchoring transpeptidase ErfK/SrfK